MSSTYRYNCTDVKHITKQLTDIGGKGKRFSEADIPVIAEAVAARNALCMMKEKSVQTKADIAQQIQIATKAKTKLSGEEPKKLTQKSKYRIKSQTEQTLSAELKALQERLKQASQAVDQVVEKYQAAKKANDEAKMKEAQDEWVEVLEEDLEAKKAQMSTDIKNADEDVKVAEANATKAMGALQIQIGEKSDPEEFMTTTLSELTALGEKEAAARVEEQKIKDAVDAKAKELAAEKEKRDAAERAAQAKLSEDEKTIEDRPLTFMEQDIRGSEFWATNKLDDQSSSTAIQQLEFPENQALYGKVTNYFMYSKSKGKGVMLQKSKTTGKWFYRYYYEESSLKDVQKEMEKVQGTAVQELTGKAKDIYTDYV